MGDSYSKTMTKKKKITYIGKNRIEVTAYTVPNIPSNKLRCNHKGGTSSPAQARYNRKKSMEKLMQKAENTFINGCWLLTYTYDADSLPKTVTAAYTDVQRMLRRTKNYYKSKKWKYAYVAAIEKGVKGRIHVHVCCNNECGLDIQILKNQWNNGHVDAKYYPANDVHGSVSNGIKAAVHYVVKEPLKKIIGRAFVEPQQTTEIITDKEFESIKKNPITVEESLPGFRVSHTEENTFNTWWGISKRIRIRLDKEQAPNQIFDRQEVLTSSSYRVSTELLHLVDYDQRQLWICLGAVY